jgi:outer membrane protein TolC
LAYNESRKNYAPPPKKDQGAMKKSDFQSTRAGRTRRPLIPIILFSAAMALAAQEPLQLDMESVAHLTGSRNWASKQAHQDVVTADAVAKRAESLRWGRVDFQSQYLRLNDPVQIKSPIPSNLVPVLGLSSLATPLAPQDSLHVDLEAGIPLFTGGKITNAIREAKAGKGATSAVAGDVDADAVLSAERNYLSVLLTREVVELNQQALRTYSEHLEHARSAYRQGVAANYDVIRAEAAEKEQERRLIEAQNQYDLAAAALRTSLALEDATPVEVRGHLFEIADQVDLNEAMAAAVKSNFLLKALDEKTAADRDAVRVQEGDYLPQITGIAGREMVTSKLAQTDPTWFAGARVTLNLFDGGERRARVSEEKSRLQTTQFERHHAEDQIQLAVRSAYLTLQSQRGALASATKAAELAKESLRLATKRFEVGTGTSLEVLDATVSLTSSQTSMQQALYGMDVAFLTMHRYEGDILEIASRIQR